MIETNEKLKILFSYSHGCEYKPTFYIYQNHPNHHNTAKEVLQADQRAARDIEELQIAIDNLKEIRAALAARYNELATMPYTYALELTRYAESHPNSRLFSYTHDHHSPPSSILNPRSTANKSRAISR